MKTMIILIAALTISNAQVLDTTKIYFNFQKHTLLVGKDSKNMTSATTRFDVGIVNRHYITGLDTTQSTSDNMSFYNREMKGDFFTQANPYKDATRLDLIQTYDMIRLGLENDDPFYAGVGYPVYTWTSPLSKTRHQVTNIFYRAVKGGPVLKVDTSYLGEKNISNVSWVKIKDSIICIRGNNTTWKDKVPFIKFSVAGKTVYWGFAATTAAAVKDIRLDTTTTYKNRAWRTNWSAYYQEIKYPVVCPTPNVGDGVAFKNTSLMNRLVNTLVPFDNSPFDLISHASGREEVSDSINRDRISTTNGRFWILRTRDSIDYSVKGLSKLWVLTAHSGVVNPMLYKKDCRGDLYIDSLLGIDQGWPQHYVYRYNSNMLFYTSNVGTAWFIQAETAYNLFAIAKKFYDSVATEILKKPTSIRKFNYKSKIMPWEVDILGKKRNKVE